MLLQTKFLLALVPPVVAALLVLGGWSAYHASSMIHQNAENYLSHVLDTFTNQDLERRHQILKKNQMDQVPSFVRLYQKEAAQAAAKLKLVWPGLIFALDRQGKLVFSTRMQNVAAIQATWRPEAQRLASAGGKEIQGHLGGYFFRGAVFRPWGWRVFVAFDDSAVHRAARRIQVMTIILALLSAGLMVLGLSFLFRRFVAKPIRVLRGAAEDIAAQNYPDQVAVKSNDELGSLARDMEKMTREIRDSQSKILQFTDQLENMVAERTERLAKSQTSLARAQAIARLGSYELNLASNEFTWSDEVFRIFGLKPGAMIPTFKSLLGFIHPDDLDMARRAVETAVATKGQLAVEHRLVRRDGQVRVLSVLGEVFPGHNGKPDLLSGTVHDITERKKAEGEQMAREKLQGAIETAGAVCHELNQPMQAIMSRLELLLLKAESPYTKSKLAIVAEEVRRMADITAKLQNITKYETRDYVDDVRILDLDKSSR